MKIVIEDSTYKPMLVSLQAPELPEESFSLDSKTQIPKKHYYSPDVIEDIIRKMYWDAHEKIPYPFPEMTLTLPPPELTRKRIFKIIFEIGRRTFHKLKKELINDESYRGKFIAVYKERLLDCDEDNAKLAKRVYDEYGYLPIYIDKIQEKLVVVKMRSPRLL